MAIYKVIYAAGDVSSISSTASDVAPTYESLSISERKEVLKSVSIKICTAMGESLWFST